MTSPQFYLTEGMRMLRNKLRLSKGFKQYNGNADEICRQIIDDCWNGKFFQSSTTNFCEFWTRDFGISVSSLIALGYGDKVEKTLAFALEVFSEHGKVTTTIDPKGKPFDFPCFAVDSLPWLLHSCTFVPNVIEPYKDFLAKQVKDFCMKVVSKSGLIKPGHYSSIKDFAVRNSSCYDNCMLGLLTIALKKLSIENPLSFDYGKIIIENFWNGMYFYDDMEKYEYISFLHNK